MSYRLSVKSWFDNFGFFSDHPQGFLNTGNAGLYTGHHFRILEIVDQLNEEDRQHIEKVCKFSMLDGQHIRHPEKSDEVQSHDDITGLASASQLLGTAYAQKVFFEGIDTGFAFSDNSKGAGFKQWLRSTWDRHPGFICHLSVCAQIPPRIWDQAFWSAVLIFATFSPKNSTSGRLLKWQWVKAYRTFKHREKSQYLLMEIASRFFEWRTSKTYGSEKIGGAFKIFFGPTHPFTKAMLGKF